MYTPIWSYYDSDRYKWRKSISHFKPWPEFQENCQYVKASIISVIQFEPLLYTTFISTCASMLCEILKTVSCGCIYLPEFDSNSFVTVLLEYELYENSQTNQ